MDNGVHEILPGKASPASRQAKKLCPCISLQSLHICLQDLCNSIREAMLVQRALLEFRNYLLHIVRVEQFGSQES
jgi:hypothetical protein